MIADAVFDCRKEAELSVEAEHVPRIDDGPAFDDTPESSNDDGVIDDTPPDFDDSTDTGSFDDGN